MPSPKKISIVAPAFNEEENLELFFNRSKEVLEQTSYDYEILIIENGSTDNSLAILKKLHKEDPRLKFISLSRNFGHQGGIYCGLNYCSGDAVITMDADLQHPHAIIPDLLKKWQEGYLIVNTKKEGGHPSLARWFSDKLYYFIINKTVGLQYSQADFRLLDKKVVQELRKMPETEKFLRGLIAWLGFKVTIVPYQVQKRLHGRTKFRGHHLINLAFQGITSFSRFPLKLLTKLGIFFLIPSTAYIIYVFYAFMRALHQEDLNLLPPGWATLSVTIVFFGAIQLLAIGILGEYIGRIYFETKRRPDYVIQETSKL